MAFKDIPLQNLYLSNESPPWSSSSSPTPDSLHRSHHPKPFLKFNLSSDPTQGHYETKIFEQSVSFVAHLDIPVNRSMVPPLDKRFSIGQWRLTEDQFPVIIGASSGAVVLLLTIIGILIWRCCHSRKQREKSYPDIHKAGEEASQLTAPSVPVWQGHPSVVVLNTPNKPGSPSSVQSRLASNSDINETDYNRVHGSRSQLKHGSVPNVQQDPLIDPRRSRSSCEDVALAGRHGFYMNFDLPDIPESVISSTYASSSVLDQSFSKDPYDGSGLDPELKTRSLPSWVRAKSRNAGDVNNVNTTPVHDKSFGPAPSQYQHQRHSVLNTSRKHRGLRHDTAALIALSKSNAPHLNRHGDTASLVQNEAVIVFDERTAL